MLTVSEVSKAYGGRTLFEDVSLQINKGDRLGLVGPNGAGKSTLFGLLLGTDQPDTGVVALQRNSTLGFLPQESAPAGEETVADLASAITPEFDKLRRYLSDWDAAHASEGEALHDGDPDWTEYHLARQRFDELGGFQVESRAKKILKGLGFRERDFTRPCRQLSGGWVMRAHLARLLTMEPDLLMLDEPTNHLDLEALIWFQEYLKTYPGAILMISHDREFLNQLVDSIVEIRQQRLWRFRGNYDSFLAQKAAQEEQLLAAYKNQQREIAHLMDFVVRFRAKNTKAAQAQSKLKQIERMEKIEAPVSESRKISFSFPQPERSGLKVVKLLDVHQAYGENKVYSGMNFEAERDQRIVLVGPNGAGKSTLLKILAGVVPIQAGTRDLGHNVRSGYFAQYRVDTLDPDATVLEEGLKTPQRVSEQYVRTVLGCFLFHDDDVFKKVKVLSGGEKSRLALVKLLLDPPNLLLMDEPTTHLDIPSIDALVEALSQYKGTLVFISHDVYFIRAIAKHVVHVNAGVLTQYAGDYQYYLDKTGAVSARVALTAGDKVPELVVAKAAPRVTVDRKEQRRIEAQQRQARSDEKKRQIRAVAEIEAKIAKLEARQIELTKQMEDPATYEGGGRASQINRELADVTAQIARQTALWETESAKVAEPDNAAN